MSDRHSSSGNLDLGIEPGMPVPWGKSLEQRYFTALNGSIDFTGIEPQIVDNRGDADVTVYSADEENSLDDLARLYLDKNSKRATSNTWWNGAFSYLAMHGFHVGNEGLPIQKVHSVHFDDESRPDKTLEIVEIGNGTIPQEMADATAEALSAFNSLTNGYLTSPDGRRRVARRVLLYSLTEDDKYPVSSRYAGFFADGTTAVDLGVVMRAVRNAGVDAVSYLKTLLAHELMGHGLDMKELRSEPRIDGYFGDFFEYSARKVPSRLYPNVSVHDDIAPLDELQSRSRPAREYGEVDLFEDYASATDALVAHTMGWHEGIAAMPRQRSNPDNYRNKLVIENWMRFAAFAEEQRGGEDSSQQEQVTFLRDHDGRLNGFDPNTVTTVRTLTSEEGCAVVNSSFANIVRGHVLVDRIKIFRHERYRS